MRMALRALLWLAALVVGGAGPGAANVAVHAQAQTGGYLSVSGPSFVLDGQPFVMKGFNYYPANYGWSSMTDWDWNEVDQELAQASALGANVIRTMVDYGYSTGHPSEDWTEADAQQFQQPSDAYVAAMRQLLSIADSHGLKVEFSLFDYVPGWLAFSRTDYSPESAYVQALVSQFADDPRVAAWSIHNEGDLTAERFPDVTNIQSVMSFYAAMSGAIRTADPNHLVTVDLGRIGNGALSQGFVDFISFHYYADPNQLPADISTLRAALAHPMPIVAGELGSPSAGNQYASEPNQTVGLDNYLDIALRGDNPLAGALVWNLVDQNPPRTALTHQRDKGDVKYGVLDGNLQPKPAAAVVQRYFSGGCSVGDRIELRFPNAPDQPPPNSGRLLQVGVSTLSLLNGDGSPINTITFGTPAADQIEGAGWYANESWGQWAGQPDHSASLCLAVPAETRALRVDAHAVMPGTQLQVWYLGTLQGTATLQTTDASYDVPLNPPS